MSELSDRLDSVTAPSALGSVGTTVVEGPRGQQEGWCLVLAAPIVVVGVG